MFTPIHIGNHLLSLPVSHLCLIELSVCLIAVGQTVSSHQMAVTLPCSTVNSWETPLHVVLVSIALQVVLVSRIVNYRLC